MRTFRAIGVPGKADELPRMVGDMQRAIEEAANRADPVVALTYLGVAPTKPENGLYLSAAGVLGASRGLYRYDSISGTYTFIA